MGKKYVDLIELGFKVTGVKSLKVDDNVLLVPFGGEDIENILIYLNFAGEDGELLSLDCPSIIEFPEDKVVDALMAVNNINEKVRFIKLHLTEKYEVFGNIDITLVNEDVAYSQCMDMIRVMVTIIDKIYPELKAYAE